MSDTASQPASADFSGRARPSQLQRLVLWIEFLALFGGVPAAIALALDPRHAFGVLAGMTLLGMILLSFTREFRWRDLLRGGLLRHWLETVLVTAAMAAALTALTLELRPDRFLAFPKYRTDLWLVVMALYPILSVLPQELLYRALFFERYGALFPSQAVAILVNSVAFGFAHAFYANWTAVLLTTVGSTLFAWAYVRRGSFLLACLWHSFAGQILFTAGLGVYFYHGAIPR
ncbi:MAG: CPBP family intramembrane metalloprotease [Rhodobacteraceae bacterium]|nr:CPBP family intramembrane metalloprotease [Paracoccaceae bacterium]